MRCFLCSFFWIFWILDVLSDLISNAGVLMCGGGRKGMGS